MLSFGADDAHDYLAGVPAGRSVGPLGSASWDAEYERRVEGVTRELNAKGIYVVWLGLPITDHHGFRASFPVVNGIIERVVKENARMSTFVDTWKLLERQARPVRVVPAGERAADADAAVGWDALHGRGGRPDREAGAGAARRRLPHRLTLT